VLCLNLLLASRAAHAETPTASRTFEDILKNIPQQDFLKLRGAKKDEGAMELSKTLMAKELNKEGTFALKVDKVETWPFPQGGVTGWRIWIDADKERMGSVTVDMNCFVYVREDPSGTAAKLKKGQKITVTGRVSRCDFTAMNGPVLHVDIQSASIAVSK
jgi:hypothetical protein